jgi:hypothetical protein
MDGVTFCGSCGAQIESHIPQSTETPQQNVPVTGTSSRQAQQPQPYQQQPSNQQTQPQPYGGEQPRSDHAASWGGPSSGGMVPPKNYMVESIIVTVVSLLCCCSPVSVILGIIAIVKANNVNPEFERGNYNEALKNAGSAKTLTIWAAIITVVFSVIFLISYLLFFAGIIADSGGWDSFLDNM